MRRRLMLANHRKESGSKWAYEMNITTAEGYFGDLIYEESEISATLWRC